MTNEEFGAESNKAAVGEIIFDAETETAVIIEKSMYNPFAIVRRPMEVTKLNDREYLLK